MQEGGLNARYTLKLDLRDRRKTVSRDFGVFSQSSGFDGRVGWSRDRSGGSHDLNAEAARAISITESWILRQGWCDVHDVGVEPMLDESKLGAAVAVWRMTPKHGVPIILRFNRRGNLLPQAEYRMCGNRLICRYDDWRDVGWGIMIAFSERDEDPEGEETQTITVSSVMSRREVFPSVHLRAASAAQGLYDTRRRAVDDGSLRGRWRRTHLRPSACQR